MYKIKKDKKKERKIMTNKEIFIKEIEESGIELSEKATSYFELLKKAEAKQPAKELTENGAKILKFMQENEADFDNVFKAKEIGEGLFVSGRSIGGAMKKLISEGFAEKVSLEPVTYGLTDKGREKEIDF